MIKLVHKSILRTQERISKTHKCKNIMGYQMFKNGSKDAEENSQIQEFMTSAAKITEGKRDLSFTDLQHPDMVKFLPHISIVRPVKGEHMYKYLFWGGNLTNEYGKELTGKKMSEGEFDYAEEELINLTDRIIKTQEIVFTSGTLDWKNKDHRKWHMVSLPLVHKNNENEAMSFVVL